MPAFYALSGTKPYQLTAARFPPNAVWQSSASELMRGTASSPTSDVQSPPYDSGGLGQPPTAIHPPLHPANHINGHHTSPTFPISQEHVPTQPALPTTAYDSGGLGQSPSALPPLYPANAVHGHRPPLTSSITLRHTPTQSALPMTDCIGPQGVSAQPPGLHARDGISQFAFFEHMQPSTSIPDGEPFPQLALPQLPGFGQSTGTLSSPPSSTRTTSSRSRCKTPDEPQSLQELTDPPPGEKPSYSMRTLIRCAILSHPKRCASLAEIYELISNRFPFFNAKEQNARWKNHVRHHLSLSPSFTMIPRPITEPGKGNYWMHNADAQPKPRPKKPKKRKRDDDDETSARGRGSDSGGGRVHTLALQSPPSNARSSGNNPPTDLWASPQHSPSHGSPQASLIPRPPEDHHSLPPVQTLFAVSSVHTPPSPYTSMNRSGTWGNGALDVGGRRDQSQRHHGSSTYPHAQPALPVLRDSFFSDSVHRSTLNKKSWSSHLPPPTAAHRRGD